MKIETSRLNPLYDQYSNPENRLTHALLHTVGSSKWLISRFLKQIVGVNLSLGRETIEVSSQKEPFSKEDSDPEKVESVPDGWILTAGTNKLGIAIEVKNKKGTIKIKQLEGHSKRVSNYEHPYLLVITPDLSRPQKVDQFQHWRRQIRTIWRSWDEIYRWLINIKVSKSKISRKDQFLVSSMKKYLETRREVLGFLGIYFPNGFNVTEAKEILASEMEALQPFMKDSYKDLVKRRPAITTFSKESVWDCFGSKDGFTSDLHITLGINEKCHDISITVPNSAKQAWSRLKEIFSNKGEQHKIFDKLKDLRKSVPHFFIEFNQRHFIAQKFGIRDGYMEFNIETFGTPFKKANSKVKEFPIWMPAIKEAILNKRKVNGQVMFKVKFYLNETKGIDKPQFINVAKSTINALKPLYNFLHKSN